MGGEAKNKDGSRIEKPPDTRRSVQGILKNAMAAPDILIQQTSGSLLEALKRIHDEDGKKEAMADRMLAFIKEHADCQAYVMFHAGLLRMESLASNSKKNSAKTLALIIAAEGIFDDPTRLLALSELVSISSGPFPEHAKAALDKLGIEPVGPKG